MEHVDPEAPEPPIVDVIALNDAVGRLHEFDPRKSEIVELHFFGGLSYDETAEAIGVPPLSSGGRPDRAAKSFSLFALSDVTLISTVYGWPLVLLVHQ